MLRLRLIVLLCAELCALWLYAPLVHAGGRGGGAHFAPHFSAPHIAPQPRIGFQTPRALPSLGIPPSRWGRPVSPVTALRAFGSVTPRSFRVPAEQNPRWATGSIRHVRVWPGSTNAFARRAFSPAPFGGLRTHLHTRLQSPRFGPFFATRRHHLHRHAGLWRGALFWPSAYSDFFDYTFDPYAYDGFWPDPYADLYQGIFADPIASVYAALPAAASGATLDPCGGAPLAASSLEQIAQTLQLNDAQRAALDALNETASEAVASLGASCTQALPNTPILRIAAMQARLSSMLRGLQGMRPALARFYTLLSEAQKAQLNAPASGAAQCIAHSPLPALPVEAIARELRVNGAQRAALLGLAQALVQASDMLESQCAAEQRLALPERFEQIAAQLRAALRATEVVEPALAAFHGLLGDGQKARFDRLTAGSG